MVKMNITQPAKPVASLSLDLDNKWSYMKTHGDEGWQSFPSYLDCVVPRVLAFMRERHLAITFFVVGQDAALEKNSEALAQLASADDGRHEIGNHSFHHEPWLHLYQPAQVEDELARAEEHIERVTARHTVGFRGPGYSLSPTVVQTLVRRGYEYDASTLPTFLGPLARAYYFMTTKLSAEQKEERKILFGGISDGLRPLKPYRWQTGEGSLVEIPVTTMPLVKIPIHVSYLLYLSSLRGPRRAWTKLAHGYFETALRICKLTGTQPSLLLHPLDFLGPEEVGEELRFFPAMNVPLELKLETVSEVLRLLSKRFDVLTMRQHARHASQSAALPVAAADTKLRGPLNATGLHGKEEPCKH